MYKLYNVKRWGSMAPHFVLEELGVPYQNIWMAAEQVSAPEFKEVSPLGYIPALGLVDGRAMIESGAIVAFLTLAHADKGLCPEPGSADHAVFLSWLHFMSTNIYPAISLSHNDYGYGRDAGHGAHIAAVAEQKCHDLFGIVERRLIEDGPYVMGESFSALDLYLFMLTIWAPPTEAQLLAAFPAIARLAADVRARPKLKAALEAHGVMEHGSYPG